MGETLPVVRGGAPKPIRLDVNVHYSRNWFDFQHVPLWLTGDLRTHLREQGAFHPEISKLQIILQIVSLETIVFCSNWRLPEKSRAQRWLCSLTAPEAGDGTLVLADSSISQAGPKLSF